MVVDVRSRLKRRRVWADRPLIDVVAARRLRTILTLRRAQRQQRWIIGDERDDATRQADRRGEKDIGLGAPLHEVPGEGDARPVRLVRVAEHPLRRRRAMIDVASVDIGTTSEKEIDYTT